MIKTILIIGMLLVYGAIIGYYFGKKEASGRRMMKSKTDNTWIIFTIALLVFIGGMIGYIYGYSQGREFQEQELHKCYDTMTHCITQTADLTADYCRHVKEEYVEECSGGSLIQNISEV